MKKITFFGFLYVDKDLTKLNFKSKNFENKYSVYLKNAALLNILVQKYNHKFVLLTNNKFYLKKKIQKEIKESINLKQISFKTYVPKATHFYSCHYRVDVFKYLANLKNKISILMDLDVVILKSLNKLNISIFENNGIVHDISNNFFPAYGFSKVKKDLEELTNFRIKNPKWYGGDFVAGSDQFFKLLYLKTKKYQTLMIKFSKKFSQYTDELFLTAAIIDIKENKDYNIINGAVYKLWTRYWSINTIHKQHSLHHYLKFYMIHLPADKNFIANYYDNLSISNFQFERLYSKKVSSYSHIFKNKLKKFFRKILW